MNPIGYLFVDESYNLEGQILIKPQLLEGHWVERVDLIDDWINQLQIMKLNAARSKVTEEDEE